MQHEVGNSQVVYGSVYSHWNHLPKDPAFAGTLPSLEQLLLARLMCCCRFWPVRNYPWGTCEALSSVHSDLAALKRLLFEVMYEDFKQQTEARYYKFRQNTLFNLDDPNRSAPTHRLRDHLENEISHNFFHIALYTPQESPNHLLAVLGCRIIYGACMVMHALFHVTNSS